MTAMAVGEEPRKLRADAARNRQALVAAAGRLFAGRGLSVTLDDIAAEAGVNVATAYRHFANKHELAAAYIGEQTDVAIAIAEEAAAVDDPWDGLHHFLSRMLDLVIRNRGLHDVLLGMAAAEWYERLDGRVSPVLGGLVTRGQQAGVVRRDLTQEDVGVIVQMLTAASDIPTADPSALVGRYLDLVLAGLRPSDRRLPGAPPSRDALRAVHTTPPGGRRARPPRGADVSAGRTGPSS
jgi:AcrR family transcriptional regulator